MWLRKSALRISEYAFRTFTTFLANLLIYRLHKSGSWHSSFWRTSKHWVSWVNTSTTELEKLECSVFFWNCNSNVHREAKSNNNFKYWSSKRACQIASILVYLMTLSSFTNKICSLRLFTRKLNWIELITFRELLYWMLRFEEDKGKKRDF